MTETISRFYRERENADAAAAELRQSGLTDSMITVVGPTEASDEDVLASIRRGGVVAAHAEAFAAGIRRGETLVSVRPLFGWALNATAILRKHGPTDTGMAEQSPEEAPPDPATPLSSALGWTVLIRNPAPLSSWLKWPLLSTRRSPRKPDSQLVDNPAPFSKAIHGPVLTERPTILSSRVGWRVLWDNPAPLSTRLRWPILSKQPNPPAVRFGLRLLSDQPAPLSARLGLKLLSKDPAPLSRLLGWRVSSDTPRRQSEQTDGRT